jgi:hypothetical protein
MDCNSCVAPQRKKLFLAFRAQARMRGGKSLRVCRNQVELLSNSPLVRYVGKSLFWLVRVERYKVRGSSAAKKSRIHVDPQE